MTSIQYCFNAIYKTIAKAVSQRMKNISKDKFGSIVEYRYMMFWVYTRREKYQENVSYGIKN